MVGGDRLLGIKYRVMPVMTALAPVGCYLDAIEAVGCVFGSSLEVKRSEDNRYILSRGEAYVNVSIPDTWSATDIAEYLCESSIIQSELRTLRIMPETQSLPAYLHRDGAALDREKHWSELGRQLVDQIIAARQ